MTDHTIHQTGHRPGQSDVPPAVPLVPPSPRVGRRPRHTMLPTVLVVAVLALGALLIGIAVTRAPSPTAASAADDGATAIEATSGANASVSSASTAADGTTGSAAGVVAGDVSDLVAGLTDSVVRIEVTTTISGGRFRGAMEVSGSGSGIILTADGTIVTNAHVVDGADMITVVLADGTQYAATLVGEDATQDVAVVSINAEGLTPVAIGDAGDLAVGDVVVAIGYPLGIEGAPSVSTGIVSALDRHLEDSDTSLSGVLQTDAAITEGSSGGALFDADGNVIGMTTAVGVSSVGIEGIGFAIPVGTVTAAVGALTGS